MTAGIRKVAPIPIIATVPPETVTGNGIRVPATVDLSGYPEYGNCHISRVVDFMLLLDYGEAGESASAEWLGVGHGMGYVYATVTPSSPEASCGIVMVVRQSEYSTAAIGQQRTYEAFEISSQSRPLPTA